jgi:hypothetical protein
MGNDLTAKARGSHQGKMIAAAATRRRLGGPEAFDESERSRVLHCGRPIRFNREVLSSCNQLPPLEPLTEHWRILYGAAPLFQSELQFPNADHCR